MLGVSKFLTRAARFRRIVGVRVPTVLRPPGLSPLANVRASRVFKEDMVAGGYQELFCERATSIGLDLLEKKYIFQAWDGQGHEHFRKLSRLYPGLRFVYVYGWDGWNEHSYGSYLIRQGHIRRYRVP